MRVNAVRAFAQKATQAIRAPPPEKERRNAPPAAPDATARRTARSHPRGRIVSAWRKRKMSPVEAAAAEERRAPRGASDERRKAPACAKAESCLLYTSDAADEEDSVDLGGR